MRWIVFALAFWFGLSSSAFGGDQFSTMRGRYCPADKPGVDNEEGGTSTDSIDYSAFADLCKASPAAVVCVGTRGGGLLTFSQVKAIDDAYRPRFRYRDDLTLHAPLDDWYDNWTTCGDCEDYALTLSELLARAGQAGDHMDLQFMLINVDKGWYAHATLWVRTSDRGIVEVDVNDRPRPLRWSEGVREGFIRMDGRRVLTPLSGFQKAPRHPLIEHR
ncbi:hypothetical protein GC176_20470 [bacterium]|nr:hypothetical protein [bacterium]